MDITTNLLSTQVPTPLPVGPISQLLDGAMGQFTTGMTLGVSNRLNQLSSIVAAIGQVGTGGYGVIAGLVLGPGGGLTLIVSPGQALVNRFIELVVAPTNPSVQQAVPPPYVLPDNLTSTIWLTAAGALTHSLSLAAPPGGYLFLGTVVTAAGAITGIDTSGRITLIGGQFVRRTADPGAPQDVPDPLLRLQTITNGGSYLWDGTGHKLLVDLGHHLPVPAASTVLSADVTLTANSPNLQWFVATGANRTVNLPLATAVTIGHHFTLVNASDPAIAAQNYNLLVNQGGTTLTTLTPGTTAEFRLRPGAGNTLVWPTPSASPV